MVVVGAVEVIVIVGLAVMAVRAGFEGRRGARRVAPGTLDQLVRHRVIVTLKSDVSFEGVLVEADGDAFVLHQAVAHGAKGERVVVDGVAVLLRSEVSYLQQP